MTPKDTPTKLDELRREIIADLSNAYYQALKNETQYINMKFDELGAVCRDLANQDLDEYVLGIIGEDEPERQIPQNDYYWRFRNELRQSQRKRLEM